MQGDSHTHTRGPETLASHPSSETARAAGKVVSLAEPCAFDVTDSNTTPRCTPAEPLSRRAWFEGEAARAQQRCSRSETPRPPTRPGGSLKVVAILELGERRPAAGLRDVDRKLALSHVQPALEVECDGRLHASTIGRIRLAAHVKGLGVGQGRRARYDRQERRSPRPRCAGAWVAGGRRSANGRRSLGRLPRPVPGGQAVARCDSASLSHQAGQTTCPGRAILGP